MAARATPNASAVVTMRDLEGDLSLLQRVAEFLPIEQLEKSHTVKAVSRAWRTAARRALTRGRWKPMRTLEGCRELICSDASYVDPEARRALKRAAQEAWALYPGEVMLFLLDCVPTYLLKFKFLSLVVESSKQGFGSIVVALEKSLQLERHHINATLLLLGHWVRQAMPGSFPPGSSNNLYVFSECFATSDWLGDALGRWADLALAVKVVNVMIWFRSEVWLPRLDDLARSMSVNWADSGKRARFVALLAERQAQEDADPFYATLYLPESPAETIA